MYMSVLFNMQGIRNWNNRKLVLNVPKLVTEHEGITVLWNQGVQADREGF
jgi:hypothetical protein